MFAGRSRSVPSGRQARWWAVFRPGAPPQRRVFPSAWNRWSGHRLQIRARRFDSGSLY